MPTVLLALGTNLGDRVANLRAALAALPSWVQVARTSPVYETEPQYVADQPLYLNMALQGETDLRPGALLDRLKRIERELGRTSTRRFGPRVIDLDILFYGEEVLDEPDLTIPHPRLDEREFVLRPLADIAPERVHPLTGRSVWEMLSALPQNGGVVLWSENVDMRS